MKWKLQGSASTIDTLIKLIKDRWYWTDAYFRPLSTDPNVFNVYNANGLVDGVRVVKKKNRFRLEFRSEGA